MRPLHEINKDIEDVKNAQWYSHYQMEELLKEKGTRSKRKKEKQVGFIKVIDEPEPVRIFTQTRKHKFFMYLKKRCPYCGVDMLEYPVTKAEKLRLATWDHVVATHIGGKNDYSNKIVCCALCNSSKGHIFHPMQFRALEIVKEFISFEKGEPATVQDLTSKWNC